MKRVYFTIGMVFIIAVVTALAFAGPGRRGIEGMRGGGDDSGIWIILRLKDRLGLSDEQVGQLKAITDDVQAQYAANAEPVRAKKDALEKAVQSGASEADIRAAADAIGKALGEQAVLRVKTKARVDGVLTNEQKAKLEELKNQRAGRGKSFRGRDGRRMDARPEAHRGFTRARGTESAFARIDTNEDGVISLDEFTTHMEQMKVRRDGRGPRH